MANTNSGRYDNMHSCNLFAKKCVHNEFNNTRPRRDGLDNSTILLLHNSAFIKHATCCTNNLL